MFFISAQRHFGTFANVFTLHLKCIEIGSIIINNGEDYATSRLVTLSLNYNDANGISWVQYSNDGVWDTESWETPSPTKSWTITPGDGPKTVYYQMMDNVGITSSVYSDTIDLESPPTPSPTPTQTPSPTVEPTPTPAPTATPTSTLSPTETATPTPLPSESPFETLQPIYSPTLLSQDLILYGLLIGTVVLFAAILAVLLWKK